MSAFLELRDLVVIPGDARAPALDGVSLEIDEGSRIGIAGPSGSGKSTLARALLGLEPRMTGSLRFEGRELVGADPPAWTGLRRRVALCWQDSLAALDPRLTIRASVDEARGLAGLQPTTNAQLTAAFERMRLPVEFAARKPGALSGGQRQRAALARALTVEPDLLVADEITSGLDRAVEWEIVDVLVDTTAAGAGLLFITHDLSLLPRLVEEVVILDEGRIVERGSPQTLLARPAHATTQALVDAIPRLSVPRVDTQ